MRKFTFYDSFLNQMKKKLWLDRMSLFMVFLIGQFIYAQEYQHLQIATGLTQDVIANGVGNASSSTTSGVDVVNFAFVSNDFQATVSSPALTFGLPVDGLITSAVAATPNLTFQLASYTGTNSLKLEAQNSSSTLTFSNNVAAKKLLFLVTSGSGISTFTGVITFADNSTQTISSSTIPDWFNSTTLPVAISGIGRINTTNNTTENPSGNPRLYQLEIPILVANQTKVISSIEITKTSLAGNALNLFAVTAELLGACPSPDALTASALTTSATVSWNLPAILPTEGYQYYYSDVNTPPTGSTVPSGTVLSSATSVALSSLLPSQNYYFWIRSNCGNDEFGTWQFVSLTTATPGHIGSGSATSSYFPIYSCYGYNYSQQIYLASELQAVLEPGNTYISKIRFKSTTLPTTPANFASWTVYMGNTTQSVFVDSDAWVPAANLTQVYSGNLTFTANDWVEISLNVGFIWDGTSNLVIGVDENTPNYSCTATWASFPSGSNRGILYYSDTNNPDPSLPPTANYGPNANIAQIQIVSILPPNCLPPSSIVVSNVTANGADLDWSPQGVETTWQYAVGLSTVTDPSGLTPVDVIGGVPTATISTGLVGNTNYKVWVRSNCGSEFSPWAGPIIFKTLCGDVTEFSENFDSLTSNFSTTMPDCWDRALVGTPSLYVTTGSTAPMSPSNRLYMFVSSTPTTVPAQQACAILPSVSNLSAGTHRLRFKAFSTQVNRFVEVGYLTDPTDINSFVPLEEITIPGTVVTNSQQFFISPPASVPAGVKHLAILNPGFPGETSTVYIDDVIWEAIPSCPEPTSSSVGAITATSAQLTWTEGGTATAWNIEWGTAGFSPTGTPNILETTTNPYNLTGLTPNTAYSYYVQASCGGTSETSVWVGPFNFTTPCIPYTIPYFEGFESGYTHNTAVSGCFVQASVTGTAVWTANNTLTTYNRAPRTGGWNAFLQYGNEDWLFIPIELVGGTSYTVELYARQDGATAANSNMLISYGTSATAVAMTNAIVPATGIVNGNYQQITGAFTPSASGVYYVGIKGFMNGTPWYISLDDISIDVSPACLAPTNLVVSNVTSNSANLGWTENGTATVWDIEWGTAGFTPTGTPTILGTTTNPHALTGLDPNTAYSFYVRTNCGGTNGESTWSGPFNFTTACIATTVPYVMNFETAIVPALPNCTSIQNVGTGNLWTVANNPGFGFTTKTLQYLYNGSNAANVWFYTQGLNLTAGTTYSIAFDYGSNSTAYVEKLKVAYGTSATAASMTNVVVDLPSISNNTPVTSLTEFTPTTTGVYYFGFNVYSAANQYNLYVDNIVIDVSLSTGSFDSSSFSAYPNPVKDVFNFAYSNTISDLVIYNLLGQQVLATKPNATQGQVDMSSFPNGTYLVKVTSENQTKTIKVIKN